MAQSRTSGTGKPAPAPPAKPVPPQAQVNQPVHAPQPPFLQPPRTTTDDPWRDLHPALVWPD
jgi:hypothetical protein